MLKHIRRQYPVGQGFFHAASLQIAGAHLDYIYDCGSDNSEPRKMEIKHYLEESSDTLDVLFLSHLDRDHVNGLGQLLLGIATNTVVLPYLSTFERLLLVSSALDDGVLDREQLGLVADPTAWLIGMGVNNIIYIDGSEDQDPLPVSPDLPPFNPDRHAFRPAPDDTNTDLVRLEIDLDRLEPFRIAPGVRVYRVPHDQYLLVRDQSSLVDWCFLTFVHPERELERTFRKKVEELLGVSLPPDGQGGPPSLTQLIAPFLRTRAQRSKLAQCYTAINKDRNLTSMSLYSGPFNNYPRARFHYELEEPTRARRPLQGETGGCGWLATGDANLSIKERAEHFNAHYAQVRGKVLTFGVPHHGSRYSWNDAILPPNCKFCTLCAAKKNNHGHPHDEVTVPIRRARRKVYCVSDSSDDFLTEAITFGSIAATRHNQAQP